MAAAKLKNNAAFSLIELSVVLIILGIVLVAVLQAYRIYDEKSKIERMKIQMATIDQNITSFYKQEGRFPCPAPINGETVGNDFDVESCSSGVLNVAGTSGGRVLIGKVPAATLGLKGDIMRDLYGSYLTYAVTQAATVDGGSIAGAIRVREEDVDRSVGSPTQGEIVETENHENITYLVISHGKARIGAWAYDGTRRVACDGASKEGENCNDDGVFRVSLLSEGGGIGAANYFDDVAEFKKDDDISDGIIALRPTRDSDFDVVAEGEGNANGLRFQRYQVKRAQKDTYVEYRYEMLSSNDTRVGSGNPPVEIMYKVPEGDLLLEGVALVLTENPDPSSDLYSSDGKVLCRGSTCNFRDGVETPSDLDESENYVFMNNHSYKGSLPTQTSVREAGGGDVERERYETTYINHTATWVEY